MGTQRGVPPATAALLLVLLLVASLGPLLADAPAPEAGDVALDAPAVRGLVVDPMSIRDAIVVAVLDAEPAARPERVETWLATWTPTAVEWHAAPPAGLDVVREDLFLLIVAEGEDFALAWDFAAAHDDLAVREVLPPAGLLVQGTPDMLAAVSAAPWVVASHPVPRALVVDLPLVAAVALGAFEGAGVEVWVDGWRDEAGVRRAEVGLAGFTTDLDQATAPGLAEVHVLDEGRRAGVLAAPAADALIRLAADPSVAWVQRSPSFVLDNDRARTHLRVTGSSGIATAFNTDLNGSGQIVAVADSGLDGDHGDFGTRVRQVIDSIGDGSTADTHTGHGTHVSCTVLGDGTRSGGAFKGVAPQAALYFQALENDATGDLFAPSLHSLIKAAHNAGARTHTNSWGSKTGAGSYTVSTEDIDSRTNHYDRIDANRQGITVLFAAGNDGSGSGTVTPPGTAKNVVTVGSVWNRAASAPNQLVSTSSRGPTDDARIKPDVVAPGGRVRSCLAQEAQDTGSATWSNTWYQEQSGTSMATPNAAGVATLIREYLTEISFRPEPQGALVKALLILGARDIGTRDIPNNNEGWGLVDAVESLNPGGGRGIWVDDRSTLTYGGSRSYNFNVSSAGQSFKAVLAWSDWRGARQARTQLMNDLNLIVTAPDGTTYLGNDFASGRSRTGGSADAVNTVEVVLVDQAGTGLWTVEVEDIEHRGRRVQPYAIAVSAVGANDLRPDPAPVPGSITFGEAIPQVDMMITVGASVQNLGNFIARDVLVELSADAGIVGNRTVTLGPGETLPLTFQWTPQLSGLTDVILWVDRLDTLDEISDLNNEYGIVVNVTAPGIRVDADAVEKTLPDATTTFFAWQLLLTNTALLPTNASITAAEPVRRSDGVSMDDWFAGFNSTNVSLDGGGAAPLTFTLSTSGVPSPGAYDMVITGHDVDHAITYPLTLTLVVPTLPEARFERGWGQQTVSPVVETNVSVSLWNEGNADQGYDLSIASPSGWRVGLAAHGSVAGAPQGSTGTVARGALLDLPLVVQPPTDLVVTAGAQVEATLTMRSQVDVNRTWTLDLPFVVGVHHGGSLVLESDLGQVPPDAALPLQFSLTNGGNDDANYTPTIITPGGWSVTAPAHVLVAAGDTADLLITLRGDPSGGAGTLEVRMDSDHGERVTWEGPLDVLAAVDPRLTFARVVLEDGSTAGTPLGAGDHPPESPFQLVWSIRNQGSGTWRGSAQLSVPTSPLGWTAVCDGEHLELGPSATREVVCLVRLPRAQVAGSEPAVALQLEGDGVTRSDTVTLRVAILPSLTWSNDQVPTSWTSDEAQQVELLVTNVGNAPTDHVLEVTAPAGWTAAIEGATTVELAAGASRTIRLTVTPGSGEAGELAIGLRAGDDVVGATHTIALPAAAGDTRNAAGAVGTTLALSGVGIALLLLIATVVVLLGRSRDQSALSMTPPPGLSGLPPPPPPGFVASVAVPAPVGMPSLVPPEPASTLESDPNHTCWICLQHLAGAGWQACPTCGARYHAGPGCGVERLERCRNCEAPVDRFVLGRASPMIRHGAR